ncbi:acyl-CoA dehydrogenase family protein [Paenibacillus dendritiformis]|uniref:acyl-CoA dehydrogenase family protein n=1 Tax=Paenibacillus dendritiformis TaxID=130049 RepID=UPI00248BC015|nr:acyl-CoA dehydrogenase family protein [Paenibacillus dendritiformis]WGU96902.1 acyl-CoA dehydrogenase family protein [Paenibacillus dendritiformis]
MNAHTCSSAAQVIEEARQFAARELRPLAGEIDASGELPRSLIAKMGERGYLAASWPEEYGGLGLDPVAYGLLTEQIGKACSNTRALLTVQTSLLGETMLRFGTEAQKQLWLPQMARAEKLGAFALSEPLVGSDAKSVQTTYRKDGARYILNGSKKWISFAAIADFFVVIAADAAGHITSFIVEREREGVRVIPMGGMLGNRAVHIAEIQFDEVEVPADNVLGNVGGGFTYVVSTALDHGRYSIAWAGAAIAAEALEAMVTYARSRSQFGEKLHHFQLVKGMIGDAVTKVHAARSLCLSAGELRRNGAEDAIHQTTIAKYFTSKIAVEVTNDTVQIHGGNGCRSDYPAERLFREAKVLEIIEGTSQIQQQVIAQYGLRKYAVKKQGTIQAGREA